MNFFKSILLIFLLTSFAFAEEYWRGFSNPFPINSAIPYGEGVLVATDGGIRYRTLKENVVYTSSDGLETSNFKALAFSEKYGYFAVSEYGIVARLNNDVQGWTIFSHSFVSNGVQALPDKSRIAEHVLVIAFADRIAFFDLQKGKSILTINRIGDKSLTTNPPRLLEVHGDSLFVTLGTELWVRTIDWKNISNETALIDPDLWEKIPTEFAVLSIAWQGEKRHFYAAEGTWTWNEKGEETSTSIGDTKVTIRGKIYTEDFMFTDGANRIRWIYPAKDGGNYLVHSQAIIYDHGNSFEDISENDRFSQQGVYELYPHAKGGIIAASYGKFAYSKGGNFEQPYTAGNGIGNVIDGVAHRIKAMAALPNGYMLYHVWGHGFYLYSDWGKNLIRHLPPSQGLCLDEYLDDFVISVAAIPAPDGSGFLTTTAAAESYSLIYISLDGELSCAKNMGSEPLAGPLVVTTSPEKEDWTLYVSTRGTTFISAAGGVDKFSITPPSKTGGRLTASHLGTYNTTDKLTPIDMVYSKKNNIVWLVSTSTLQYFDVYLDTIKQPTSTKGLQGAEYSSIELDVHDNLWVGSSNQGAYRLSQNGKSIDTLLTFRYTTKNGLLNNNIADLKIDPVDGAAWFAHENGVSLFKKSDLRNAESFMTDSATKKVIAYPNPFRPKEHAILVFDNVAENSTISVFNRGGSLVKFFTGSDLLGGRAEWDGCDQSGKYVAPGVYQYVVKNSKEVKRGKIIIIR